MTGPSTRSVVVGVAAGGSPAAVAYAVDEATRQSCGIRLVSVVSPPPVDLAALSGRPSPARAAATEALTLAERHVHDLAGANAAVRTELVDAGWAVHHLVDGEVPDRLIVLERRRHGPLHRILSGSTVHGVVGRTSIPVVVVPGGWPEDRTARDVVTLAVQDAAEAATLLPIAFAEAQRRHAALVVLHAWCLADGFDVAADPSVRLEWTARAHAELDPLVAAARRPTPDVVVEVIVTHGEPLDVLLQAADGSDLVVIGRRHHLLPLGTHLGPVARALLDHSTCPVLVAPDQHPVGEGTDADGARARPADRP